MDEEKQQYVVGLMVQHYGDLLKVSRSKGIFVTLPELRKEIQNDDFVRESYREAILAEIEGQGLTGNAQVSGLLDAQLEAFAANMVQNTSQYADELKKLITAGSTDRSAGDRVELKYAQKASDDRVQMVLEDPNEVDVDSLTDEECSAIREHLLSSFEIFAIWVFQIQMGFKFQRQDFHSILFQVCDQVVAGTITRLVVNIPPRFSKTQIFAIDLPLYAFVKNPRSHSMIVSYAEDVVAESSGYIRTIMLNPLFMRVFPELRIDQAKRSLDRWGTTKGGVLNAQPTGGRLTGKGAGTLQEGFCGLFVVDDPIKPKDAYSDAVRAEVNTRYDNTFLSRLANDGTETVDGNWVGQTPMVIIMQRLHQNDLVGHLLQGKSSCPYRWLNIPSILEEDTGSAEWYAKQIERHAYTHAKPIIYKLERETYPAATWAARKSLNTLMAMKAIDPYTFFSQYQGEPTGTGVGLVAEETVRTYEVCPLETIMRTFMTADTASTTKTYSDYSVICLWGVSNKQELILIDLILGKWEIPDLKVKLIAFWNKCNTYNRAYPRLLPRALYMENKASGLGLNQQFKRDGGIRLIPMERNADAGDKVTRFMNAVPYFAIGKIILPLNHEHSPHFLREVKEMTSNGSGTGHDDCADNVSDAVEIAFGVTTPNYDKWVHDKEA